MPSRRFLRFGQASNCSFGSNTITSPSAHHFSDTLHTLARVPCSQLFLHSLSVVPMCGLARGSCVACASKTVPPHSFPQRVITVRLTRTHTHLDCVLFCVRFGRPSKKIGTWQSDFLHAVRPTTRLGGERTLAARRLSFYSAWLVVGECRHRSV